MSYRINCFGSALEGGYRAFVIVGAVVLLALPQLSAGQQLRSGAMPIGVRMQLEDDVYLIGGSTAREILGQLEALGPGSGWAGFPMTYSWTLSSERVRLVRGVASDRCRTTSFDVTLLVTATYPRWTL